MVRAARLHMLVVPGGVRDFFVVCAMCFVVCVCGVCGVGLRHIHLTYIWGVERRLGGGGGTSV